MFAGLGAARIRKLFEEARKNAPAIIFDEGLDVLIRVGELSDSNLVARSIGWLEQIVVASPSYLAENGEPKDPTDLAHRRWVFPARIDDVRAHSPHLEFTRDGKRVSVTASTCIVALDNIGLPESVVGGAGIACLSSIAFFFFFNAGLVKRILSDWNVNARPVYAVFPHARAITPKTVAIVDLISELVAEAERVFPSRSAALPRSKSVSVYQTAKEGEPALNARSVASA
jgi:DNA-binding transcriptional LysR family regulator